MRARIVYSVVLVILAAVFHPSPASACSCITGPETCPRIADADAIFEATVESVEVQPSGSSSVDTVWSRVRLVRLRDVRPWRGDSAEVMVTGMGGGDCGYDFAVGERYVIVAYRRDDGRLETGICSKTRPIAAAEGFRQYIESLSSPSRGGSIWGRVLTWTRADLLSAETTQRLAAPVVSARVSVRGSQERTATTDRDGTFSFAALPPGEYSVSVDLPANRKDLAPVEPSRPFRLDGAYACDEHNFWVETTSQIEGTVVDESGAPASDLFLNLMPVGSSPASRALVSGETTDASGRYLFSGVAPGRYVVGISIYRGPDPRKPFAITFGRDRSGRSELVIPPSGGSIEVEPMVLRRLVPLRVQGTVVWSNGGPASGIELTADFVTERGLVRSPMIVNTGPDGTFTMNVFADHRYRIRLARGGRVVDRVDITATGEPIAITLRSP